MSENQDGEILQRVLAHIDQRTTDLVDTIMEVPAAAYHDRTVAEAERARVFRRLPLAVALGSELRQPGSYSVVGLPGSEVLLVRQSDQGIKAFINACRHRGAPVAQGVGQCRSFSCPYHGWTYALDGRLQGLTYAPTFGDVEKEKLGLLELPAEERHGIVWVVDDTHGQLDLDAWLGSGIAHLLEDLNLPGHRCAYHEVLHEPANWKLIVDGFHDNYHLRFLHAKTIGPYVYTNTLAVEPFGPHVRFTTAQRAIDRARKNGAGSGTVGRYLSSATFVMPNLHLVAHPDHVEMFLIFPDRTNPEACRLEVRLLWPKDDPRPDAADRAAKSWRILNAALGEDLALVRRMQTVNSRPLAPDIQFGRNEAVNQHFHRKLAELAGDDPASRPV